MLCIQECHRYIEEDCTARARTKSTEGRWIRAPCSCSCHPVYWERARARQEEHRGHLQRRRQQVSFSVQRMDGKEKRNEDEPFLALESGSSLGTGSALLGSTVFVMEP
jgi:hypothetical protein